MTVRIVGYLLLLAMAALGLPGQAVHAAEQHCDGFGIRVVGTLQEDRDDACVAVSQATQFIQFAALTWPGGVSIQLVDGISGAPVHGHEMGRYDARSRTITMRDYASAAALFGKGKPGREAKLSRAHWRSFLVHEMAHAAIHAGCDRSCPSRAIHEYIAVIAQASSLPPEDLIALLEGCPDLPAFAGMEEVTDLYYEINPQCFAAKSYKHFHGMRDQGTFLRALLHPR